MALEAAFCYCCRHFSNRSDPHFTITGFSNWQHALEKNKGFSKHAASIVYMQAMAAWKEKEKRANTKQKISTLVNEMQLEQNRYYVTSIVEVIQFLCINELPLRGDGHSSIETLDADNQDELGSCVCLNTLSVKMLNSRKSSTMFLKMRATRLLWCKMRLSVYRRKSF